MAGTVGDLTPEEWVTWAYRLFLGRLPESADAVRAHTEGDFSVERLRGTMAASAEFRRSYPCGDEPGEDAELRRLKDQFRAPAQQGREGFFTDFLGVRTRCSYLPPSYAQYSGAVEQADGQGAVPLHDAAELRAMLLSASEAVGSFCVVELGAGWGPWLVAGATMAARRGVPYRLIGVEGDAGHYGFMRTHVSDNGIDPDAQRLVRAVVGSEDGTARFPVLEEPSHDWGAKASFGVTDGMGEGRYVEVPCTSLASLLRDEPVVDILHCDIQGAEADTLEAAAEVLDRRVRRLIVGTHGRGIEDRLLDGFARRGWHLESEQACKLVQHGTEMLLAVDGVQVWLNGGWARDR